MPLTVPAAGWQLIAQRHVAVTGAADTNENTLLTATLNPTQEIGPNGQYKITCQWTVNNNGNVKTARIRYGGASGDKFLEASLASITGWTSVTFIRNVNSVSSQKGYTNGFNGPYNSTTATTPFTATQTGTGAVTLLGTVQKATAGDTMTLESYTIEALYGA